VSPRRLDQVAVAASARLRATPFAQVAVASSHAGRGGMIWLAAAPLVGGSRRPVGRREGVALTGLAVGSALAASALLARTFQRPRPCDRGVRSLIPCPEGGSLPSDQAAAAFAASEVLGWLRPQAKGWLLPFATLVAGARVVVGAHYATDVVAGAALGSGLGRAIVALTGRRLRPRG
jgi:membrane-associated phospholipid phosphatase